MEVEEKLRCAVKLNRTSHQGGEKRQKDYLAGTRFLPLGLALALAADEWRTHTILRDFWIVTSTTNSSSIAKTLDLLISQTLLEGK